MSTVVDDSLLVRVQMRSFADIMAKPLRWLWPGRVPLGKLTLFVGDPGLGKSLLTVDLAARISRGIAFPDGTPSQKGASIFLSAEDDAEDTIRPCLDAAGADVSMVHIVDAVRVVTQDGKSAESTFCLGRDVDALDEAIRSCRARLVVIDPVSAYLGAVDSHANADVRALLSPLVTLAAKHGVAVIAVTHLRKSPGAAIYRAMGSLAFAAAARSVWGIVQDADDKYRRLFLPVKQNLAPNSGGLAYRTEAPHGVVKMAWESAPVTVSADELMNGCETF